MIPIASSKTVIERSVREGTYIQHHEKAHPCSLINSKGEFGRGKMVRFTTSVERC